MGSQENRFGAYAFVPYHHRHIVLTPKYKIESGFFRHKITLFIDFEQSDSRVQVYPNTIEHLVEFGSRFSTMSNNRLVVTVVVKCL